MSIAACAPRTAARRALAPPSIARCVSRALRDELAAYPKPGLVSPVDSGSHPDMDVDCFRASIRCLEPFFERLAHAGSVRAPLTTLQEIGLEAEAAMLEVTGGRNTHRGAIFSLGLLAAAAGFRTRPGAPPGATLGELVATVWGGRLPSPRDLPAESHGIAMCRRHGVSGARGEARLGFPAVYHVGLPALRRLRGSAPMAAIRIQVFFELLLHCDDTTLLRRGGEEGRRFARSEARVFLSRGGVLQRHWRREAIAIHRAFITRNLTAGGVADLLAATLFVDRMEDPR